MIITYWIIALFMAFSGVSGTVGATTLTEAQLAAHSHVAPGHLYYTTGPDDGPLFETMQNNERNADRETENSGKSQPHAHSFSGIKSGSASSLPPYYALAYIMRCA